MRINNREERQHNPHKPNDQRKEFQIDRDRIIYSMAFRRLAQVTQVVSASEGNVFHNRLIHSLKVAQVGRRLAEKLIQDSSSLALIEEKGGLDPDVVEAAALAHDLGHPPFGHIAEKELNQLAKTHGLSDGFEGNAQTFRILTKLEPHRTEYPGLNLTRATLNATLKYPWFCERDSGTSKTKKRARKYSVFDFDRRAFEFSRQMSDSEMPNDKQTLEASIMDFADDVTYSVHDLEDFYLGGLISLESLTKEEGFEQLIKDWLDILPDDEVKEIIKTSQAKDTLKNLIKFYVPPEYTPGSIEQIAHTKTVSSALIQRYIQSVSIQEDYSKHGYLVRPQQVEIELGFLQQIVRKYVILNPRLTTQQFGQRKIIQTLFDIYREAVEKNQVNLIPTRFLKKSSLENLLDTEENKDKQKTRIAIDIVASFSEAEAVTMYRRLTGIEQGSVMDYIL